MLALTVISMTIIFSLIHYSLMTFFVWFANTMTKSFQYPLLWLNMS